MNDRKLRILQVSTADELGGAERVARNLFETYRARGYESWLAVGRKRGTDPDVIRICHHQANGRWSRFWWRMHLRAQPLYRRGRGGTLVCRATHRLAAPGGLVDTWRGREEFRYPGTWSLPEVTPHLPDVIHCHNLHGRYFDLRALPALCRRVPVLLTLHDAWMLSGHCAHSFDCERWKTGCGECPDLAIYPPIRRDASAWNWQRKRDVYAQCRVAVATPSRWLMQKVEESMLLPGITDARVIPNGVDVSVFQPEDRRGARAAMALPQDSMILLFAAAGTDKNPWRDFATLRAGVSRVSYKLGDRRILVLALGSTVQTDSAAAPERIGRAEVRFVPFQSDAGTVARYYQSADLYIHAARADTFPNAVLEALACGAPVVATAIGGIPEQIETLKGVPESCPSAPCAEAATGILVPPADPGALCAAIERLLGDPVLRHRLSVQAVQAARARFDLHHQADRYLDWYEELRGGAQAASA